MNIWSGAIALDKETQLEGLRLIDPTSHWQSDLTKDSSLRLRCFVNPALIPLYARSGPNLELHTADDATAEWLKDRLVGSVWLEEEDLERFRSIQCSVGFLVGVEGVRMKGGGGVAAPTTDLLVYGVLSCGERPPTPPGLSSDYAGRLSPATRQKLRIYASPLSADVIARAHTFPTPPQNVDTPDNDAQFAEFLPDLRSPSPKRKRVASLFESAAQHHKRVRQKGGEAVAQLMAPLQSQSQSQSSQQLQNLSKIKRELEEPSLPAFAQRSRSVSMKPLDSRPGSNRGHVRGLVPGKNTPTPFMESSLKREHSPPGLLSSDTKREQEPSSSTPRDPEIIITENKNTITRTILTCMRLYGFSRSSTRPGSTKHTEGLQDDGASTEEDEFKAMYHATYRASTFALRRYLRESVDSADESNAVPPLLEKQKAMGYIDEFLRLFCEEG